MENGASLSYRQCLVLQLGCILAYLGAEMQYLTRPTDNYGAVPGGEYFTIPYPFFLIKPLFKFLFSLLV